MQQVAATVDSATQPLRNAVDHLDQQTRLHATQLELHNARFEQLERQLEMDKTPAAKSNSTSYDRTPDNTIVKVQCAAPVSRLAIKETLDILVGNTFTSD
eukprot:6145942-Karenia_brevis.AAC.1